jgi:hypothetical protein
VPPSLNFPQLNFVKPSSGFHPVTWERVIEDERSFGHLVKWKHFSFQNIVTKKGEEKKELTLVFKSTPYSDFIKYLKLKLQFFVRHNFVSWWQDIKFKNCLKIFSNNTIVSVIDFAKNYNSKIQNKMQSMHSHSYQVTILVAITYSEIKTQIQMMRACRC